jgi:glucose-1-phosphate thymidylyltransferase
MLEANRIILSGLSRRIDGVLSDDSRVEGPVEIGVNSVVSGSVLRGPVVIGRGCRIERAYVGPFTSIADNVTIVDSEIEHSIILEGSTISGLKRRMESSLIGRDVTVVRRPDRVPSTYRLMVGDHGQIEVV